MHELTESVNWKAEIQFSIGIDNWKAEKLAQLESIIEIEIHSCSACVSQPSITAATSNLGNWLDGKIGLYL
jgi:hypothetical protein